MVSQLLTSFVDRRVGALGLSQAELSKRGAGRQGDISYLENGKVDPWWRTLLRHAGALGCGLWVKLVPDADVIRYPESALLEKILTTEYTQTQLPPYDITGQPWTEAALDTWLNKLHANPYTPTTLSACTIVS